MLEFSRWKIFVILSICIISLWLSLPTFLSDKHSKLLKWLLPESTINLGLDLRGGSHLLLNVDFSTYLKEQLEMMQDSIRKELRTNKIGYSTLKADNESIRFTLRNKDDLNKAEKVLYNLSNDLIINKQENKGFYITFKEPYLKGLKNNVVEQSIEIIRRRVDETGTKEPSIQRQGEGNILLQVPGLENPEHLKRMLGKTAKLTFHLVDDTVSVESAIRGQVPHDSILLPGEKNFDGQQIWYVVKKKVILSGDMLMDAKTTITDRNDAAVAFKFNNLGAKLFADVTRDNAGHPLAIVLDNKVISAPMINEPILGGNGIIHGSFTVQSANDLALLLRAGALPAQLTVIEERTVGPSLGMDSIIAGKKAGIVGTIMIMVFMIWTYGILGLFANIALFVNLILISSGLSMLQATLTMPGIAGIILTMGMAVDANVLIFERIREDLHNGSTVFNSLENGFRKAFTTILDSNLTTILVAIFLYIFGSGTIKGFAVTLIIGIVSSMFSAITLTRLMVATWYKHLRPKRLTI
jgi:preprotein translocase subunit SecD